MYALFCHVALTCVVMTVSVCGCFCRSVCHRLLSLLCVLYVCVDVSAVIYAVCVDGCCCHDVWTLSAVPIVLGSAFGLSFFFCLVHSILCLSFCDSFFVCFFCHSVLVSVATAVSM